jgi:WD40 repeat protein
MCAAVVAAPGPRYDRCICSFDVDKLDKPKESFKRVRDCARAGITSLALDQHNNVLLCGSLDGALRVWSMEGRCELWCRVYKGTISGDMSFRWHALHCYSGLMDQWVWPKKQSIAASAMLNIDGLCGRFVCQQQSLLW